MPKELTYEKALNNILVSCSLAYSEFCSLADEEIYYKGYSLFEEDYKAIKKLEEAIEKAKKYDLLAKEKE